jgi:hypothetical protein
MPRRNLLRSCKEQCVDFLLKSSRHLASLPRRLGA